MRTVYISGFIFLFLARSVCAQVVGAYSYEVDKERIISYGISLYKDSIYTLTFFEGTSENHSIGIISCGSWSMEQEKIVLTDRDSHFQSTCIFTEVNQSGQREITVEESFKFLTGLKFIQKVDYSIFNNLLSNLDDVYFRSNFDESLAQKEREKHYKDKIKKRIFFGEYGNDDTWRQLLIYPDNTYILNYRLLDQIVYGILPQLDKVTLINLFYSEGTWERKGNVLILYDTSVNCRFYLIITRKGLKPNQMMFSLLNRYPLIFKYVGWAKWRLHITAVVIVSAVLMVVLRLRKKRNITPK